MIVDLPATSVGAIGAKLRRLRADTGAMALSRVLTLVVVVDDAHAEQALSVATKATHQHPSRIVCVVNSTRRGASRIDGQLRLGGDAGASEIIVLRLYGDVNAHAESLVLPLLLADSPVVAWWPYEAPKDPANDPIGKLAQRRITDAEHAPDPSKAIASRAKVYQPGDTDLVWTRTTKWRSLLAAVLEQPPFEPVTHATVAGGLDSGSADLMAAWLGHALQCPVTRARSHAGTGLLGVRLERASGPVELIRPDGGIATLGDPGQPVRRMALPRRSDEECLSDELSRLDADEVYEGALMKGLGLLKGKGSMTLTDAVADGLIMGLDAARTLSTEVERATSHQGSAAMMEAAKPAAEAEPEAVHERAKARHAEVKAERADTDVPTGEAADSQAAAKGAATKGGKTKP